MEKKVSYVHLANCEVGDNRRDQALDPNQGEDWLEGLPIDPTQLSHHAQPQGEGG